MKIKPEFVQLYEPLFLAGINFGLKLYPGLKGGIHIEYDTDKDVLYVTHKSKMALIKTWASMTIDNPEYMEKSPTVLKAEQYNSKNTQIKAQATGPEKTIRTAQVSTPMDKVQGVPGKKAKYQGSDA